MGNCLCSRQPVVWADDIDDDIEEHLIQTDEVRGIAERVESTASSTTEVRIRISKKKLLELLRKADAKGLTVGDVMKDLIHMSMTDSNDIIHYHWRPVLRSIAEEPDE
ncbi:uncharacterized protein LOC110022825 [Phalaenopsis equestris]|uniref:uncharacterized protein LOC110022825 n=1 Tax=Phalaenopsis equestris TaxID=78828 RepID=UPI0009E2F5DD|nr:uncharacterized protein LOC110022825 [Phalaenopsis equestris]